MTSLVEFSASNEYFLTCLDVPNDCKGTLKLITDVEANMYRIKFLYKA